MLNHRLILYFNFTNAVSLQFIPKNILKIDFYPFLKHFGPQTWSHDLNKLY